MISERRSDNVVALIVAAGFSQRFGRADKRAVKIAQQQTLLASSHSNARAIFKHCRVILRDDDNQGDLGLPDDVAVYSTANARLGQGASMADGFRALLRDRALADIDAAAVWLGDMPYIRHTSVQQLLRECYSQNIVRPIYQGRAGHPVVFGRRFWPELTQLNSDTGAIAMLKRHRQDYREVTVNDPGVCRDIDTPNDLPS